MGNLVVTYDTSELGDYVIDFPKLLITGLLDEALAGKTQDEVMNEILINNLLQKIISFTKPYQLTLETLKTDKETKTVELFLKAKDIDSGTCPKLIPDKRAWFIIGCGLLLTIEMCTDIGEYSKIYAEHFSGEYDFAYFCTLDENLEIIDWHGFYDFYAEENQVLLKKAKDQILKKYGRYIKKVGNDSYLCIIK